MSEFKRPPGSIDVAIAEIPVGSYRVRLTGTVIDLNPTACILTDGQQQLPLQLGRVEMGKLGIGSLGRAIVDATRTEDRLTGVLIAWNPMTEEQIKKYRRLVKIERRIPK